MHLSKVSYYPGGLRGSMIAYEEDCSEDILAGRERRRAGSAGRHSNRICGRSLDSLPFGIYDDKIINAQHTRNEHLG